MRIGSRFCALPLEHVAETMRPLPVESFTGMPQFVLGLSVIRGIPTPVVDCARVLDPTCATVAGRLVTVRAGARVVALAVDAVVGIRELDPRELHGLPPLLGNGESQAVEALTTLDAKLMVVLQGGRLLPAAAWAAVDAARMRP